MTGVRGVRWWLVLLAGALPGVVAVAPAQDPADLTGAVRPFLDRYLAAISARDTAAIRRAFVADDRFVWIEDGQVRYRRVDDLLAGLAALPGGSPITTRLADLRATAAGASAAHAWAGFTTTIGSGNEGFSFSGTISFTLERAGRDWKIVGGHTSTAGRR